jgi:hypothetical protein
MNLARYFMGLVKASDLEGVNRFITAAHTTKLCDPAVRDFASPGLGDDDPGGPNRRITEGRKECKFYLTPGHIDACQGYRELFYHEANPRYCSWGGLGELVKPGYYAKIKRGDHSTFFIHWRENPVPGHMKMFSAIGGNQDEGRVNVNPYFVSQDENADSDIIWKASRHACDCGGYLDGFGVTTNLPPRPAGVGRKETAPRPAGAGWKGE